MSNTLILDPSGDGGCEPDQNPWTPPAGAQVTIDNQSGYDQDILNITNHCLKTKSGKTKKNIKDLEKGKKWKGKAGAKNVSGDYFFNDGLPEVGTRSGRIDPS